MLARRLTTILPDMILAEAFDTTRIPCVAGRTGRRTAVVITRPCRAPCHTISNVRLNGGGHCLLQREVSETPPRLYAGPIVAPPIYVRLCAGSWRRSRALSRPAVAY